MRRGEFLRLLAITLCFGILACGAPKTEVKKEAPDDIADLRARVDDLNNRIYVLTEQLETLKSKPIVTTPIPVTKKKEVKSEAAHDLKGSSVAQEKEYGAAYELFKSGQYAKALIAFSGFADKYPASALTDNAIYWMGECYLQQKEYVLAVEEYSRVLKRFPKESKAPYAMYKIALCYRMLGEKKDSDVYLQELLTRYPNSEAAQEAKDNVELKK
jgi:tol-pal system protein YbgF